MGCNGQSHRALTAGLQKLGSKRLMARQPGCLLRGERPVRSSQGRTPICLILRHFRPVLHTLSKHHPGFNRPLMAALVGPSPQSTVQANAFRQQEFQTRPETICNQKPSSQRTTVYLRFSDCPELISSLTTL